MDVVLEDVVLEDVVLEVKAILLKQQPQTTMFALKTSWVGYLPAYSIKKSDKVCFTLKRSYKVCFTLKRSYKVCFTLKRSYKVCFTFLYDFFDGTEERIGFLCLIKLNSP